MLERKIGKPTKAEQEYQDLIREQGCICCHLEGCPQPSPTTIHHVNDVGRNMGHMFVIPACLWHHQGMALDAATSKTMTALYGPSLAKSKREFVRRYGTELELVELCKKKATN